MPSARHVSFSVENFYIEFILTFYIIYFIRFFIYIGVKPVNNVVLVSDGQHGDSALHRRIHSPPDSLPIQAAT